MIDQRWRPAGWWRRRSLRARLTLATSVGYLDAHYTSFMSNVLGTGVHDFSSLAVARAPKWTARVDASYVIDLGDDMGTLTPDTSYAYETEHFTDLTNNPVGFQKAYGLWNASLTYDNPDNRWSVSLWGKNLGDVAHRMSAVAECAAAAVVHISAVACAAAVHISVVAVSDISAAVAAVCDISVAAASDISAAAVCGTSAVAAGDTSVAAARDISAAAGGTS
jgi:hypothetical protein